jgi:hypothetical protein
MISRDILTPFLPTPCEFSNILFSDRFSDFTLVVPNTPDESQSRIPVHRFLLDACSPYFHQLFESQPDENESYTCFPGWAVEGICLVLDHFYTRSPIRLTPENVASVLRVSSTWSVPYLERECFDFITLELPERFSLSVLSCVGNIVNRDAQASDSLYEKVSRSFCYFDINLFVRLPFPIFERLCSQVYSMRTSDPTATALCNAIELYIARNIAKLGSQEFQQLMKRFTMKTPHNGILHLYEMCLGFGWDCWICENKIIHAWRHLDMDRLARFPIDALARLLRSNYLNAGSEGQIFDFILQVRDVNPSIMPLLNQIRVSSLSAAALKRFQECEFLPDALKQQAPDVFVRSRISRENVRCLILGACNNAALKDAKASIVGGWVRSENVTVQKCDERFTPDFMRFHVIVIFGLYKFWNRESLSRELFQYHRAGGGLLFAFGAHRNDAFGIGKPLASIVPIEFCNDAPAAVAEGNGIVAGCKNMRVLCRARDDGEVMSCWDDGVPFLIMKENVREEGAVAVFNAVPLSNAIVQGQWAKGNKAMERALGATVLAVSNEVRPRERRLSSEV